MLVWSHSFIHINEQGQQGGHQPEIPGYKNHCMENIYMININMVNTTRQSALMNISGGRNTSCKSCVYATGITLMTLEPFG